MSSRNKPRCDAPRPGAVEEIDRSDTIQKWRFGCPACGSPDWEAFADVLWCHKCHRNGDDAKHAAVRDGITGELVAYDDVDVVG